MTPAIAALLLTLAACSGQATTADDPSTPLPSAGTPPPSETAPSDPAAMPPLETAALVTPGRYRHVVQTTCDEAKCTPAKGGPQLPALDITVPEGWNFEAEFQTLFPATGWDEVSRNNPALALGWTNYWVGLNSEPCSSVSHQTPDIDVGPKVTDFVDAVVAHPKLDVTEPTPVKLGKHRGQFFTLTGPKDISKCLEWRPWDPSPYLQGAENIWDLWVMNVDGMRVVILAQYFPETPAQVKSDLHAMAESIRFVPAASSR